MLKNIAHSYDWNRKVISKFLEGLTAFSNPLTTPHFYDDTSHWNSIQGFLEDKKNLRADFIKSYFMVIQKTKASDRRQLSLNFEQTEND